MSHLRLLFPVLLMMGTAELNAQTKSVTYNTHTWVSLNSNLFVSKHWYVMADIHLREQDFFASPSFLFGRLGLGYQVDDQLSVAAGYGYLNLYPAAGARSHTGEPRLFQQVQLASRYKKLQLLQRVRLEQRWREQVVNDVHTGKQLFSQRLRYLLSITVPVFKNKKLPQLVLSDECMLQFGAAVVNNTFEQNRLFLGIRQNISHQLWFDAGYMRVFQQNAQPGKYALNHTWRLFFYYNLRHAAHPSAA